MMADNRIEGVIFEYWKVPEANQEPFLEWYKNYFYGSLSHLPAYAGMSIAFRDEKGAKECLGEVRETTLTPHPMLHQDGIRTDMSLNFDNLLRSEWNILGIQMLYDVSGYRTLLDDFGHGFELIRPNWRVEHPDCDEVSQVLIKEFFSLADNHWDVFIDVRETIRNEGAVGPLSPPSWVLSGSRADG